MHPSLAPRLVHTTHTHTHCEDQVHLRIIHEPILFISSLSETGRPRDNATSYTTVSETRQHQHQSNLGRKKKIPVK